MSFIDARELPEGTEIEADLIIIGGGMAGIAIAREWAGEGGRVAVLESGGRDPDRDLQDLYAGKGVMRGPGNADRNIDNYLPQSRVRAYGGSGHVWGGKSVPLDPSDFTDRSWLPMSGWPMTRDDLQPFYDRACGMLEIPAFGGGEEEPQEEGRPPLRLGRSREFFAAPRRFSAVSGGADPKAFDRFRYGVESAQNVTVYLHANVVDIRANAQSRDVDGLAVACLNGRRHTARARAYVLAVGGIENVRLLLASTSKDGNGLGNESDLVGRCFQGHVTYGVFEKDDLRLSSIAMSDASRSMALYTDSPRDKLHCVIAATLAGQRRHKTGNFTTTFFAEPFPIEEAATALLKVAGALDAQNVNAASARNYPCFYMSEHLPNRDSRVALDPASTDALGMPRVKLDWVYADKDFASLEASIAALAGALGREGAGRLCWPAERVDYVGLISQSRHHMGTTRMHRDPEFGVVDADCRMHGVPNLYVAGSSVFPTSGIANPTLTLMALAIRLADYLKGQLGAAR